MFTLDLDSTMKAGLVLLRVMFLIFMLPIFGEDITPLRIKIFLSMALAFAIYQAVPIDMPQFKNPLPLTKFALMAVREAVLGLAVGFTSRLLFEGLVMAANLVSYQMGFATVNLLLPGDDLQSSAFTGLHKTVLLLIFLGLSFHHIFIHAIVETFRVVPLGAAQVSDRFTMLTIKDTQHIFVVALQFASPILISLLFTTAALSLLAKVFPQLNIFTLSFPISFFIGLGIYVASLPFFPAWMENSYGVYINSIFNSIYTTKP